MRIGVNCYQLLPDIGGLKQYFLRLFKELLKNDERNTYIFFYFAHNIDELSYLDDLKWQENFKRHERRLHFRPPFLGLGWFFS